MLWLLYQIALALALLLAAPLLLLRRRGHYLSTIGPRLGRGLPPRDSSGPRLWLHAVSVGEVSVAASLLDSLSTHSPILVSTITPTGLEHARDLLGSSAHVAYLPFDLSFPIRRFMETFSPSALILVEGDYWPLLMQRAKRSGLPIVVVNGRISDRNFRRLKKLRRLLRPLLEPVDCFAMQAEQDRDRLLELGVPRSKIVVTGNLKFDGATPRRRPELEALIRETAAGRKILIAGSTMTAEEEIVVDAFEQLGDSDPALLILAPRHPERWDDVALLLEARGLRYRRRSQLAQTPATPGEAPAILLLDSLGELAALYPIATAAFVGGTLVPTGGHNAIEPARCSVPVAVGPSMHNFPDLARLFDEARGWQRVADADSLADCFRLWLEQPEQARRQGNRGAELVAASRGATQRTREVLSRFLPELGR